VAEGIGIVYGGASVGVMGELANAGLAAGGEVIGVLPRFMTAREIAHVDLTELHIVDSMHERKALMAELSDAFVALPGGLGTMEETFEVLSWSQLGLHRKPVGLLDVDGYFQPLVRFLDHARDEGFLAPEHRALVIVERDIAVLIDRFRSFQPPPLPSWIADVEAT
jgi:uncharacterized protein (TIGR00730 family)